MYIAISQVAKAAGVGVETVRFYERQGLLDAPTRLASGYRQYTLDAVKRIQFIRRAKELGFSLKEIRALLTLRAESTSTCADVKRQTEVKIYEIERKIEELCRMQQALMHVVNLCREDVPLSACPILDALDAIPSYEKKTE